MKRMTNGTCYRPTVVRRRNGTKVKSKAPFYWARYLDAQGERQQHVLRLPNGGKITDKQVAQAELKAILDRVQRASAGLDDVDKEIEQAQTPMRDVLAGYVRYLRRDRERRSPKHVRHVIWCIKWMIERGGIDRLCDFTTDAVGGALGRLAAEGKSPRTVNCYRSHAYSLGKWARATARIINANPVEGVPTRKQSADIRRERRSLSIDEARSLLAVAPERRLRYALHLWTGLRISEGASLEWRDVALDGDRPALLLRSEATKAGRADELPLYTDLAAELLRVKPTDAVPTDRVFATTPTYKTFVKDLERAGIDFRDSRGRVIDRHAMRTTFISWLGLYGVDPRAQVVLARHTPQGVTLKHYQDFSVFDLWAEVHRLPSLTAATPIKQAVSA